MSTTQAGQRNDAAGSGPKVWGEYPEHDKGVALSREVVARGVTSIGTARVYGPHAHEELSREAPHPHAEHLVIATKGGFVRGGPEDTGMGAVANRFYLRQARYMSAQVRPAPHQLLPPNHDRRPIRGDHRDLRRNAPRRPDPPHRPVQRQRRPLRIVMSITGTAAGGGGGRNAGPELMQPVTCGSKA